MSYRSLFISVLLITAVLRLHAQDNAYPYREYDYNYIHYDKNKLEFPGDSSDFERLWVKMDDLISKGTGKINVVHFGGSHIQAGIYSGRMRKNLQDFYPGLNGGRGLVFPFIIGSSRGPRNYSFRVTGNWNSCANTGRSACYPGLLGIQAYTSDTAATISTSFSPEYGNYDFNRIRIFHEHGSNTFTPTFPDSFGNYRLTEYPELDYTEVRFEKHFTELSMYFEKDSEEQNHFTLYGISFENDDPGIVYHDAGINGASLPSFMKCTRLERQMKAIAPDLVIISLGTNDTYTRNFDPEYYRNNYEQFIATIKRANPDAAILMTVPNDSYYRRRYPNKNTAEAQRVIMETAKQLNCGVWDFYKIMGGFNSSYLWHKDNLMAYDRIHFTGRGYLIKGDLLFWALLKSYDVHLEHVAKTKTSGHNTVSHSGDVMSIK